MPMYTSMLSEQGELECVQILITSLPVVHVASVANSSAESGHQGAPQAL